MIEHKTPTRVILRGLLVLAAAVLLIFVRWAGWIDRGLSPRTSSSRTHSVAVTSSRDAHPVSIDPPNPQESTPSADPTESALTERLLSSLQAALASSDSDKVLQLMVRIGTLIRSMQPIGAGSETVMSWIEGSHSAELIGVLMYVLSAYSGVPDEFFARTAASTTLPSNAIPSLAVAQTFTQIPLDWSTEKQVAFWKQVFLCFPLFVPGVLKHHMDQHREPQIGIGLGIGNDLRQLIQTKKIGHSGSIEVMLGRVLNERNNAGQLLQQLLGLVSLTNEHGIALVDSALAREANPETRNALLCWLSTCASEPAREALWRAYATASVAERAQIGPSLINTYGKTGAETFRAVWSQETDPDVQVQLLRAVGRLKTDDSLSELRYAFETGSDPVREVVREEVEAHLKLYPDSAAAKALLQRVGPSAHLSPRERLEKQPSEIPDNPPPDDGRDQEENK